MDILFLYVTWLGSVIILFPAAVMVIAVFRNELHLSDISLLLGGLLGASLIAHAMKLIISRPRPIAAQDMLLSMPTDFSFPSAHTAQAASFFIALALVATRYLPEKTNPLIWLGSGCLIILVGLSRIYLKVHYPSDVIAGAALGIGWVLILNWMVQTIFTGSTHA